MKSESTQPTATFGPCLPPTPAESSAVLLIREAIASKADPTYLRELLAVRETWEASEARKAFNKAISDFQRKAPIIEKGDDANGKPYARMDRIWRTVRPLLTEVGLSVTWQVSEIKPDGPVCHLEGMLRHRDGHFQELRFDMPIPDAIKNSSGNAVQNKAQVMGSAMTYSQRYSLCASLGLVLGDDDDGNGGVVTTIDVKEQQEIKTLLDAWRGVPAWNEEREGVFWRFVNVPVLANGNHDLAKLPLSRLPDVLDMIRRLLKGSAK